MTRDERRKKIDTGLAIMAMGSTLWKLPPPIRDAVAALVEEVRELQKQVDALCPPK